MNIASIGFYVAISVIGQFTSDETSALRRELRSKDVDTQLDALGRIGDLGKEAAGLVPELEKLAARGDNDLAVRQESIWMLGRMGRAANSSTKTLVGIMDDPKGANLLKLSAINAIRQIDVPATDAREPLLTALNDDELKFAAAWTLVSIDPASRSNEELIGIFLNAIADPHTSTLQAEEAGLALAVVGNKTLEPLTKLLAKKNPTIRSRACEAISAMGPDAADAVDSLLGLLDDEPAVSRQAARALAEIGSNADTVLPALANQLNHEDAGVRASAADAIGRYAESTTLPAEIISQLGAALDDSSSGVAVQAARTLERVGPAALPELAKKLDSEESRALAAAVIGQIGEAIEGKGRELEAIVPKLAALIDAKLASGDGSILPDPTTRDEVLRALASLAPSVRKAPESVVAKLYEVVQDEKYQGRAVAAVALAQIAGKDAVPVLKKAAEDPNDKWLRMTSSIALLQLEGKNPQIVADVIPRLLKALEEGDSPASLRQNILSAIGELGEEGLPEISVKDVKGLVDMLRDDDPQVRVSAIELLAKWGKQVGPFGRPIILAALRVARNDSHPDVRTAAENALEELE